MVGSFAETGVAGKGEDTVLSGFAAEEFPFYEFELIEIPGRICADGKVGNDIYAIAICFEDIC